VTHWSALCKGPVTLPRWCAFKGQVLECGVKMLAQQKLSWRKNWASTLRGDLVPEEDLAHAVWEAVIPPDCSRPKTTPTIQSRWCPTLPENLLPCCIIRKNGPWATRWGKATDLNPMPWEHGVPTLVSMFDVPPAPSDLIGPWFLALVPAPSQYMADFLDSRVEAMNKAALKKFRDMESMHSVAWFHLLSNKEQDKRGSRALVSVEGLRRPLDPQASLSLEKMLPIAQEFFNDLHTPEPPSARRDMLQSCMLAEVRCLYGNLPRPADVVSTDPQDA